MITLAGKKKKKKPPKNKQTKNKKKHPAEFVFVLMLTYVSFPRIYSVNS